MISNYLKVAFRNLGRHKVFALINVIGLAAGMGSFFMIVLFVSDETGYDRCHLRGENIYRLVEDLDIRGNTRLTALAEAPAAPAMLSEIPGIVGAVRMFKSTIWGIPSIRVGDRVFAEQNFVFADSGVFGMFTLPMIEGDPAKALTEPFSVVLSASTARKYFGDASAVGRTVTFDDSTTLKITGVMEDLPRNTHLQCDALASMGTVVSLYSGLMTAWNSPLFHTYFMLEPGMERESVQAQFPAFASRHLGPDRFPRTYSLQSLRDIHLHSTGRSGSMKAGGDIVTVYLFSAIAVFILLIACVNFVNLATARSATRSREIGMRKVLGAARGQLMRQFLTESVVVAASAGVLAIGMLDLLMPLFNSLTGKSLRVAGLLSWPMGGGVLLLIGGVGILAGVYPAIVLSGFRPIQALQSRLPGGGSGRVLRRFLVVSQFTISVALIACTMVVSGQLTFLHDRPLGFTREHLVILPIGTHPGGERIASIRTALLRNPDVLGVTAAWGVPGAGTVGVDYWVEGMNTSDVTNATTYFVDEHFLSTYGMTIDRGRGFSADQPTDREEAFVINETAARAYGWKDPIGKTIRWLQPTEAGYESIKRGRVIGVVHDFHHLTMHQEIQPVIMQMWTDWNTFNTIAAKIRPTGVQATLGYLEAEMHRFVPDRPFDYYFLDSAIDALYQSEQRLERVFTVFSTLAILIAMLGLAGLTSHTVVQRTKEIGIRKVLGATSLRIVTMLSREVALLIVIAIAVAWPIAYVVMERWLATFAYHMTPGPAIFLGSGLSVVIAGLLTIAWQSIRAAGANPVQSLRHE